MKEAKNIAEELQPCPFCGGHVEPRRLRPTNIPAFLCGQCGAAVSFMGEATSISDKAARAAWNRRWLKS
ncbi:hypothetical protein C4J81_17285 [Deltaproteobacteria bacterium Smac51]|nr:hypothetical protein C4J81_17285 [Deltaproteobacteria bacterium Smac51]